MILVDSSAWVDFFRGKSDPRVTRLDEALRDEDDLVILPIIVSEVLQGFRSESDFERARTVLARIPMIQPTFDSHVRAARLYRTLRRKGVTVRGTVDCVIAQACLDFDAALLSLDADFERIARSTPLRLWRETAG